MKTEAKTKAKANDSKVQTSDVDPKTLRKKGSEDGNVERLQKSCYVRPKYEVAEKEGVYTLKIFAPGVNKKDVSIDLDKDVLTVTAKKSYKVDESQRVIFKEISRNDFQLALSLNVTIDADKVEAKVDNGIINVSLPVAEAAKPRKISVS